MTDKLDLVLERTIDAPIDLVWAAYTNPEHLKRWFAPRPYEVTECELDLRPGGIFRIRMLRRQHDSDERSTRLISGAMQAAERAATLVQRLLSFARRQHLEARTVDVKALVEGMPGPSRSRLSSTLRPTSFG